MSSRNKNTLVSTVSMGTRQVVNISASGISAAGRTKLLQENDSINKAVSKALQGLDWSQLPTATKYVIAFIIFYTIILHE